MKTAREWFEELPEPYRSQALQNLKNDEITDTLADALFEGFVWRETPEGPEYWDELWEKLAASKPLEPQPDLEQLVREYFEARDAEPSRLRGDAKRVFERKMHAERTLRKAVGLE